MIRRYLSSVGFPLAIFLVLAGLSLWLRQVIEAPDGLRDGKGRHDPDYIVHGFRVIKLTPAGQPQYVLNAERLTHYPDDDSTEIVAPRLIYAALKPGAPALTMSAREAALSADAQRVDLRGDVVVERGPVAGRGPLVARTEALTVYPDKEQARGDLPVTITEGTSRLSGGAVDIDRGAQTFILHSGVTGVFEPRP